MSHQRAVGTFSDYQTTATALRELKDTGFMMKRVSVAGADLDRHPDLAGAQTTSSQLTGSGTTTDHDRDNEAVDDAKKGAVAGGTVGGLTGLLVGIGALAIPGVGPVMLAGAAATAIATAISGSAIGAAAGSLAGGLVGLNVPEDRAKDYGARVDRGEYLVVVEGSATEIGMAQAVFTKHHIHDWYVYDLPDDTMPLVDYLKG
ncbi:general stress protein [Chamaesiphon sp.]|uniref:general stress protein n=1 Tax=Chamaesiphon sp. TaxID=2814140 RepID=UPI0035947268